MKYLFLILLFSSVACGAEHSDHMEFLFDKPMEDPREFKTIDPTFLIYYKGFKKDCKTNKINIPIGFADLDQPQAGVCWIWRNKETTYKEIKIDKTFWKALDSLTKKWLIYHELGHCLLNKDHNLDKLKNNAPKSIMYPVLPQNAKELLQEDSKYYINELCQTE